MKIFNFINSRNNKEKLDQDNSLIFYLKPETSLLKNKMPFFHPDFSNDIRCNLGIFIRICKLGKGIKEKFARTYFKEAGLCINLIAYDLLQEDIKKRLPWTRSVSFDGSTLIGELTPYNESFFHTNNNVTLTINNNTHAELNLSQLNLSFNKAIEIVSNYYTLKIGDFLLIEIHDCTVPLQIGDIITGYISGEKKIEFRIK